MKACHARLHLEIFVYEILVYDCLIPKCYLHGGKFCFSCEIFISADSLRTVVEGLQYLCLISVKHNVSYFLKFLSSESHAFAVAWSDTLSSKITK